MKLSRMQAPLFKPFFARAALLQIFSVFIALFVMAPVIVILSSLFGGTDNIWQHLVETVLADLCVNTVRLLIGVGLGATVLGVSLGWLTAVCDFPGRRLFDWALMLPMAVPKYVLAFVFIGILDYAGPLQTGLRSWLGYSPAWFPQIRSPGGIILVMSLALYPYVYLLARNAFLSQGKGVLEVAHSLGYSSGEAFIKVCLPLARPWIISGLFLVLMETLADFGTVSVFNYDTFTTAIYKSWYGLFSIKTAAQLSSILLIFVFVLISCEQCLRSRSRYYEIGKQAGERSRIVIKGYKALAAAAYAWIILAAAFLIPVVQLGFWSVDIFQEELSGTLLDLIKNTILLGVLAAVVTAGMALVLAYARRRHPGAPMNLTARLGTLGYALPGSLLAVGVYIHLVWVDKSVRQFFEDVFSLEVGMLFTGTIFALLIAYAVRFLAVGYNPIDSHLQRIRSAFDEASQSMGVVGAEMLKRVHMPMMREGLLAGLLLVCVDVMKEMPITLMTRPFGWNTLAVRIYEMTSEGEWQRAAVPSVALVITGFIPVVLLMKRSQRESGI